MSARRSDTWRAVVAALMVATGVAVVWGLLCGWVASSVSSFANSEGQVTEQIYVAADGTPVINVVSHELVNTVTLSRRTVDGKDFSVEYEHWLSNANLASRQRPPGLIQLPFNWTYGGRIGGATDGRRPPAAWYVVRDDESVGHCYLAGFDAFSKLPIGYIGRNGYRAAPPAREDQFTLPDTNERSLSSVVASTQYLSWWGFVWNHLLSAQGKPPQWFLYLVEGEGLWEIDLRQRTARIVLEMTDLISVGTLTALEETLQGPRSNSEVRRARSTPFRLTATNMQLYDVFRAAPLSQAGEDDEQPKYATLVAVRTDDKIVLYDSPSGSKREFVLPATVPNERLSAFWVTPDQMLIKFDKGYWSGGPITQLMWIDPAGNVQREVELKLAGRVPESPREMAWGASGFVPVTIVWLFGMLLGAPLVLLQSHDAPDYTAAVSHSFAVAWPPLIVVLAIAALLAWLTLRLQRNYRRPATGVWATFVFLLGLPGFLAYWLEYHRPKMEACPECGQIVPRDRDVCAACNTQFPPPAPIGTEIFA